MNVHALAIPTWVFALFLLTIVVLTLIVWSVKRRRRPRLDVESDGSLEDLLPSIVGMTQSTLVPGNRIDLLQNGAFFDEVFPALEAAQQTINIESFLCKKGELTRKLADILCAKAQAGLHVRLLVDGNGSRKFGKEDIQRMKDAGVRIARYHPVRVSNLGVLNNRDHRKIVVIDGKLAFTGGHCLVDTWLGNAEDKQHFRDISARVEGPVVQQLQSAFSENWMEETGDVPAGDDLFPKLDEVGDKEAFVVFVSPSGSPSAVRLLHYLAIRAAKKSITIQNPYFLPDIDARCALLEAVKRGVKVRVMIPATTASDAKFVQHASHHHYGTLLKGGIRLFDYQKTLLHQKVITVDGCWSAIGSTNFDNRSFELNDEVSLAVHDKAIAKELEETFERDLKDAKEVKLESWAKRPWRHKLIDGSLYMLRSQL